MKIKHCIIPLFALMTLASCGGQGPAASSPAASSPAPAESSEIAVSSSEAAPTYEAYTLSALHEARASKTLPSLENKYIAIKGKVTFAKQVRDDDGVLMIQSGKFAVEVTYPTTFTVNVGDAVEVKGRFITNKVGDVVTIWISTYRSEVPNSDIKVIDEAIDVETVKIEKLADLVEFDSSKSTIAFEVTSNRKNAAFVGKLSQGDDEIIVANRLSIAEKFEEAPYEVGDKVKYDGIFTYAGDETARVLRYFDKAGFSKANEAE